MDDVIELAVARVIVAMRENLGEPITIDDMAQTAMFSKFHFSRIFQRVTGLSPGRFLSALRLQEAKRLLVSTSMTVADISHVVGYNSIGTFSSRFRASVGNSPTEYRQYRGEPMPLLAQRATDTGRGTVLSGTVWHAVAGPIRPIVVSLFPARIAQGKPVRQTVLNGSGPFTIPDVPDGSWHVLAHSTGLAVDESGAAEPHVGTFGPVEVSPGARRHTIDMWLRARRVFDPPALSAQLDRPACAQRTRDACRLEETVLLGA